MGGFIDDTVGLDEGEGRVCCYECLEGAWDESVGCGFGEIVLGGHPVEF